MSIHNLTEKPLPRNVELLLKKGWDYAIRPGKLSPKKLLKEVRASIRRATVPDTSRLRRAQILEISLPLRQIPKHHSSGVAQPFLHSHIHILIENQQLPYFHVLVVPPLYHRQSSDRSFRSKAQLLQ